MKEEDFVVYCPQTQEPCPEDCKVRQVVEQWKKGASQDAPLTQGRVSNRAGEIVRRSDYWRRQGVVCARGNRQ